MTRPIRELAGLRPSDLNDPSDDSVLGATEPLVLRGLVSGWPIVQTARHSAQLGAAYLRHFYRGEDVVALLGTPEIRGRYFYNDDLSGFNFTRLRARLDKVLEELDAHAQDAEPPAIYIGSTDIDSTLPGFRRENDLPLAARLPLASIWIGNRSRIAAHYDAPDNIACVAAGRRRFTLFAPDQLANLYIGPLDPTPAGQAISLVDFHAPDLARFPKFAQAMEHAQVAELEAGDAIFIPSMWWHHVEALDPFNVLVNYWWRQGPGWRDTPRDALMHTLMTVRGLPPTQRAAWHALFRHYVFDGDEGAAAHIPPDARGVLAPLDEAATAQLRAYLAERLGR